MAKKFIKKCNNDIKWGGYQDLPETKEDKAVAEFGLNKIGIKRENLKVMTDPTNKELKT